MIERLPWCPGYGNPQIEKITHEGRQAYVEHDPVTHEPLFLRDTNKTSVHMYIGDPVDSDIRMVQGDGSTADYKEFDPFGARPEKISPRDKEKFDPYRYRFGLVDRGGTGQYLFGARFYDPNQGVWTQQDSLDAPLDPVNANRYAYAGADPINNIDPAGLASWENRWFACVAIFCGSVGTNTDMETEDTSFSIQLGFGGPLSIGQQSGRSNSGPSKGWMLEETTGCSYAYKGFGGYFSDTSSRPLNPFASAPESGPLDGWSYGGATGVGLSCSMTAGVSFPVN
ncbi:RHS repeat-associated core domain-containing protein [Kocuria sp.]|uniref:RHS repeat-associated core domain-containing protein n=1 Tax=Kocuria sp. TaxID=1871328 RepID=UPI0026DFE9B3|nr:RHS repeat-associated core domain-containing protein [Kocuria sp.]MDO5619002.1 RHS repeat-associated core domain-containing protein [Kocuria sp.]